MTEKEIKIHSDLIKSLSKAIKKTCPIWITIVIYEVKIKNYFINEWAKSINKQTYRTKMKTENTQGYTQHTTHTTQTIIIYSTHPSIEQHRSIVLGKSRSSRLLCLPISQSNTCRKKMSGAGKKVADVAFKAGRKIDWEGMAKLLVTDDARREFANLRRAFDEVNTQLQTKFSQVHCLISFFLFLFLSL